MRGLRVGLNLTYLVPGETGGSETYARMLVPALARERPDLRLTAFVSSELGDELRQTPWDAPLGVVVLPVSGRTRARRGLAEQALLPRAVRRAGVDLVHSLASTAPLRLPVPGVLTVLDLIYASLPETHPGFLRYGMRLIVPASARRSQRVIAISEHTRQELIARLGLRPDTVDAVALGPGADPGVEPTAEPELRTRFALGAGPIVLSVSAHRPHKNLERLIDAVAALDVSPAPVLVLPGYPAAHDRVLVERAHAAGVADRVRLLGWVDAADLEGLYRAATCLAFPSLAEGFGLPVLEAMRRGVPVACADATSLPEVAGDAALLFDPTSVPELSSALQRLLTDPSLRATLSKRGCARAAQFSWAATARGTLRSYARALG